MTTSITALIADLEALDRKWKAAADRMIHVCRKQDIPQNEIDDALFSLNLHNTNLATFLINNFPLLIEAYRAEVEKNGRLDKAIKAVEDLISNSDGVSGLHRNGDIAPWDEIRQGGHLEEWLIDFDTATQSSPEGGSDGKTQI